MSGLPLAGRRIIVTRARRQASELSSRLTELGAEVIELPAIEIVPPESYALFDSALENLQQYQFLIVTSANTARVLGERMQLAGIPASAFRHMTIAAVGRTTAAALERIGIQVNVVPGQYIAESLVTALGERVYGSHVLLARASIARDIVPNALKSRGATVDIIDAYRTILPQASVARLRDLLDTGKPLPDAVTFTSSSTVTNFFRMLGGAGQDQNPVGLKAVSIGPITSATLREYGWQPAIEADQHDVSGLVRAALAALAPDYTGILPPVAP